MKKSISLISPEWFSYSLPEISSIEVSEKKRVGKARFYNEKKEIYSFVKSIREEMQQKYVFMKI